jgi:hypothetical protein
MPCEKVQRTHSGDKTREFIQRCTFMACLLWAVMGTVVQAEVTITSMAFISRVATAPELPALPVIRLRYGGKRFEGIKGSHCWPEKGINVDLCVDVDGGLPAEAIRVANGDSLAVEVEAHAPPSSLYLNIWSMPDKRLVRHGQAVWPFTADLPPGIYIMEISGEWEGVGGMLYTFKMAVRGKAD